MLLSEQIYIVFMTLILQVMLAVSKKKNNRENKLIEYKVLWIGEINVWSFSAVSVAWVNGIYLALLSVCYTWPIDTNVWSNCLSK